MIGRPSARSTSTACPFIATSTRPAAMPSGTNAIVRVARPPASAGPARQTANSGRPASTTRRLPSRSTSRAATRVRRNNPAAKAGSATPSSPSPSLRFALIAGMRGASVPAIAAWTRKTADVLLRGLIDRDDPARQRADVAHEQDGERRDQADRGGADQRLARADQVGDRSRGRQPERDERERAERVVRGDTGELVRGDLLLDRRVPEDAEDLVADPGQQREREHGNQRERHGKPEQDRDAEEVAERGRQQDPSRAESQQQQPAGDQADARRRQDQAPAGRAAEMLLRDHGAKDVFRARDDCIHEAELDDDRR